MDPSAEAGYADEPVHLVSGFRANSWSRQPECSYPTCMDKGLESFNVYDSRDDAGFSSVVQGQVHINW